MSSSNGKFDPYPYNNPPMAAPYPPNGPRHRTVRER